MKLGRARPNTLQRLATGLIFVFLTLLIASAIFADLIATQNPLAQNASERLLPPERGHLFGTDGFGRDVFSRVVHGARASLYVGFFSVAVAAVVGVSIGTASGYFGGVFDLLVQRFVDLLLGFPFLVLALIIVVALKSSATSVAVAVGIVLSPQVARLARAGALAEKDEAYVMSAKMSGARHSRIIFKHVLPNCLSPVIAQLTGFFGIAIAVETTLSFLGLGVPPPFPSWGGMLQEGARQYLESAPWISLFPGLVMSLAVISFALLGDVLRDFLDPRK